VLLFDHDEVDAAIRTFIGKIHRYVCMYRTYERTTYELIETDDLRANRKH
jgi:acetaldehyde dehydrogenase (acetylating)